MEDRRVTIQEITHKEGICRGSVHSILTEDLCKQRVEEIHLQGDGRTTEATLHRNHLGNAGLCKSGHKVMRQGFMHSRSNIQELMLSTRAHCGIST